MLRVVNSNAPYNYLLDISSILEALGIQTQEDVDVV